MTHCATCNIVIPSDAPKLTEADCAQIVSAKLTWFNPKETVAGQHCMATAAWALIHDKAIKAAQPEAVKYHNQFKHERKSHFANSAVRKALTAEQVTDGLAHKRDSSLYTQV